MARLSPSESASSGSSAEHQWGSEGDRTVSFIRQPHTHTHTHKWRAQGSEGHRAPLGMCVFLPYVLMPLARFKWKDKPCRSNQLPLLLSCWNRGKDVTWTGIWTGCTARSNYNARLHMIKTDVPKMLKNVHNNLPLMEVINTKTSANICVCWHRRVCLNILNLIRPVRLKKNAHIAPSVCK